MAIPSIHPAQKSLCPPHAGTNFLLGIDAFTQFQADESLALSETRSLEYKIDKLNEIIKTVNEGKCTTCEQLLDAIRPLIEPSVWQSIALLLGKNNSSRLILQLKDKEGLNPLEKILTYFQNQRSTYQAIAHLNCFATLLYCSVTTCEDTGAASAYFNGICLETKKWLYQRIWELDDRPPGYTYGADKVAEDITILYIHPKSSPLIDCLRALEAGKKDLAPFQAVYTSPVTVDHHDSQAALVEIDKLYQLEGFRALLVHCGDKKDLLKARYQMLPMDLKQLISNIIWQASYRPCNQDQFIDYFLPNNWNWLIHTKNQSGVDILQQLISHSIAKIKLCRLSKQLESFFPDMSEGSCRHYFDKLESSAQSALRKRVWEANTKKTGVASTDPAFARTEIAKNSRCLLESNSVTGNSSPIFSYAQEISVSLKNADQQLISTLQRARTLPTGAIDVSTRSLEQENGLINALPPKLRVVHVTAEFKSAEGTATVGGLGVAVQGIVQAFGPSRCRVVTPLYLNGPIKKELLEKIKQRKAKYQLSVDGQPARIFKAKVRLCKQSTETISCYFIDVPEAFWIPKEGENVGSIYGGNYDHKMWRWSVFQSVAADLCYLFSKKTDPFNIFHGHDAHMGRFAKEIAHRYPQAWAEGKTPPVVFTYHNNNDQVETRGDNSFVKALEFSDAITTVSPTFGKESQDSGGGLGKHVGEYVKKAAFEHKLFGITNGNSVDWNPKTDPQLKQWVSVLDATRGQKPDLTYHPEMSSLELAEQLKKNQAELCAYLNEQDLADFDPKKPIVAFIGRIDYWQKGIDKLFESMKAIVAEGGQFICVGIEAKSGEAQECLRLMKEYAELHGKKGMLILEDEKLADGTLKYQGVFGSLIRAACTLGFFPSFFEPCGLIQGEFFCFGKKVIVTKTGGFADTVTPDKGYLFDRIPGCDYLQNWIESEEQTQEILNVLHTALEWATEWQNILYHGSNEQIESQMGKTKAIMRHGLQSTWDETPDGSLSPILKIELVYAKATQRVQLGLRGGATPIDLKILVGV
jgi:glycogen synthase